METRVLRTRYDPGEVLNITAVSGIVDLYYVRLARGCPESKFINGSCTACVPGGAALRGMLVRAGMLGLTN